MSRFKYNQREKEEFYKNLEQFTACKKTRRIEHLYANTGYIAKGLSEVRRCVYVCECVVDDPLKFSKKEREIAEQFLKFYDMMMEGKNDEEIIEALGLTPPEKGN